MAAVGRNPQRLRPAIGLVGDILLLRHIEGATEEQRTGQTNFVMKFQQVSAAVMAKGAEDTAFCRYNRLLSF